MKYWNGPSGAYYIPKKDKIILLEQGYAQIYNRKRHKFVGKTFYCEPHSYFKTRKAIGLLGMSSATYLGLL